MNGLVFLREEEFNITTLNDPEYPVIWYAAALCACVRPSSL